MGVVEGGGSGQSFWAKFGAKFWRTLRACFAGTFRANKSSVETSAQKSHGFAQQSRRKFSEKLHDKVLQETPAEYHWGQNYYMPFFLFWGNMFGNYYRKLCSINFLEELITVM